MSTLAVGDLVFLPARLGPDHPAYVLQTAIVGEPGRIVSIEDGHAMVDRGSWGQFGCPVEDLRLARPVSTKKGRYGNPAKRRPVAGDLARYVQPTGVADPRRLGGDMAGPGGPRDSGAVFLDLTDCVLLDHTEVCTVDTVRTGQLGGQAMFMTMSGRINKKTDRVKVGYVFGPDGAAALITELLAVADRFGAELLDDLTRRLTDLHQGKNVDLHFLRAAVDNAIESAEERD